MDSNFSVTYALRTECGQ